MADTKVRVQDDLYEYVNGDWEKTAEIPADKATTGGFSDLDTNVEKILMADFKAFADGSKKVPDKYLKQAVLLYKKALDFKARDESGVKPTLARLAKIQGLKSLSVFNGELPALYKNLYRLPFRIGVDTNMKDTAHHALILAGPDTILPDTSYYKDGNPSGPKLLALWSQTTDAVLKHFPLSDDDRATYIKDTLAFDKLVAARVKSSEEWAEYNKCYNPTPVKDVQAKLAPVAFEKLVESVYGKVPEEVIVFDPRFLTEFSGLFNKSTFTLYVHWSYVLEALSDTAYLSDELRILGGAFNRALSGSKVAPSQEKHAYRLANRMFSEPVGIYYGKTYFGEKAKADVIDMVKSIVKTYEARLTANTWLSPETKAKAVVKLEKMILKMGYPDKPQALYDKLKVDPKADLFTAVTKLEKAKQAYGDSLLYEPVDRTIWVMPGHLVNACYNPTVNDITFPAAILQAPFYSIKQSRSENLGGIGTVIGHEISHAFDNNGAQCDEYGNLNNWWKPKDFEIFKGKTQAMIDEFNGLDFSGGKVNGKLIVSENIADNGGMAAALQTAKEDKDVDLKGFFLNYARVWRLKERPEYAQLLLAVDVHAPHYLRADIQPRNFPEWYEAFDVKPTDKMYIQPSKRVNIW